MATRVGIVDCSISNLTSVLHAFRYLGVDTEVTRDPASLGDFSHLVLPGVGSFARGMKNLNTSGFSEPLRDWVRDDKPLLGLCLGMQLLAEEGEEFGLSNGLGLVPGRVVKMQLSDTSLRLPHVGWNEVISCRPNRLLAGLDEGASFYFVHSYCYEDPDADYVVGVCEYGLTQVAMIESGNVFGAQFHPEKSQKNGLKLLKNFISA